MKPQPMVIAKQVPPARVDPAYPFIVDTCTGKEIAPKSRRCRPFPLSLPLFLSDADDVRVGPRGAPWHLNVLGVELRDAPVEKISVEDLGTPAAPALVSVTLEGV